MRFACLIAGVLCFACTLVPLPAHAQAEPTPEFALGFRTLASLIPDVAGRPLEAERHAANGDGLQQTTTGLMVWRKADNWTAFTDGSRTWINGPAGLQVRSNGERFPWESSATPAPSQPAPPPAGPALPPPTIPMPAPPGYSNLVFSDTFPGTSLDSSKWIPQIATDDHGIHDNKGRLPYPFSAVGNAGLNNAEYGDPSQVTVTNGLILNANPDYSQPGYSWKAGYVSTFGKFRLSGGYVQIKAKMPDSRTGGWGGIWFLDEGGGNEIDLAESGYTALGTEKVNRVIASNLHTRGNSQQYFDTGMDLSADYHVYGMEYRPGQSITMYFDGKPFARFTSNVPTGAYTIILTNTLAQATSGWHTGVGNVTPPSLPMGIAEVQVWK